MDSLGNAEVVRYFTAEAQEAERFGAVQRQLENQMTKVNESLALLNFGQQLIFTGGLALALLHTANLVAAGAAPVGQIVLVSTLLLQVIRPTPPVPAYVPGMLVHLHACICSCILPCVHACTRDRHEI